MKPSSDHHVTTRKVAVITGGAKRIGAAIAKRFYESGWNVVIHHRAESDEVRTLVAHFNAGRARSAIEIQGDLLSLPAAQIVGQATACYGRVDLLVNNASWAPTDQELAAADWSELFKCNALVPYQMSILLREELAKHNGCIVNMLDVRATSHNPAPGWSIYTASKAALHSLTLSMAKEWAPTIRVNAVSPGITLPFPGEIWEPNYRLEMQNRSLLHKTATPEEIADAVNWLAGATHVTGQVITVDGGESLKW